MNALIVFCEGAHDVAFVRSILESMFSFERVTLRFSQYPSPFNQLFKRGVERHAAQDMALDMAHKFFLPDQVLRRDNEIVLLFNSGGKSKIDQIKGLLTDLVPMIVNAGVFLQGATEIVNSAKYLFFYDADDMGADAVRNETYRVFNEVIAGEQWMVSPWIPDDHNPFAAVSENKAIYIWGETPDRR